MLLNQETLRLIFGLKLRNLRLDRGLSLKDLAEKTGLSISYLNEIEKGKKYPKPEKISLLTESLGESYDELISLKLKKELSLISQLLEKGVLQQMPFEVFGIPSNIIFELLAEHPKKMRVLVGSMLEVARAHNIRVEDFLYSILRAYLDMHQNYFPGLEEKASEFSKSEKLNVYQGAEGLTIDLQNILFNRFGVRVVEKDLSELNVTYFWSENKKTFVIDSSTFQQEKLFLLARQTAYQILKIKEQPLNNQHRSFESFEQLFNHFSANYVAGAILIPQTDIRRDLERILKAPTLAATQFDSVLNKYACMPENLFFRMSQMLPRFFNLENLFVLRYEFDRSKNRFEVSRELHLSNLHSPHAVKKDEHYCARWLTHKLANKLLSKPRETVTGIQRSKFLGTENEYLILACGFSQSKREFDFGSVSLGIAINSQSKQVMNFLKDEGIPSMVVSSTCERCYQTDCQERLAPLDPQLDPSRLMKIKKALQKLENTL